MRLRALAIIKGELGTMEAGGHCNVIKYNAWWGWGAVAYCVIGIAWAWVKAGSKAFKQGRPLGEHRRHAGRRQGRPQRHPPARTTATRAARASSTSTATRTRTTRITCIRVEGGEVVTGRVQHDQGRDEP